MRPRLKKMFFIVPMGIAAMVIVTFIGGELVKLLWNWLLPPLFGWRMVTFWQGLGILALCRILFGGLGWKGSHRSGFRRRMEGRRGRMTPDQRERFRRAVREWCGADTMDAAQEGEPIR